jgi:hypothetical protein
LHCSGSTLDAEICVGGEATWRATSTFDGLPDLARAMAELSELTEVASLRGDAVVLLDNPWVEVRDVSGLPKLGVQHLRKLVAANPTRFFPRCDETPQTAARWINSGTSREANAVARVAAGSPAALHAIMSGAAEAGISIATIQCAADRRLRLVPEALLVVQRRRGRRRLVRAAVLMVSCCTLAMVSWMVDGNRRDAAVRSEMERLRPVALAALGAQRQVLEAEELLDSLAATRVRRTEAAATVVAIVAAMGDAAHLEAITWNEGGTGEATGTAASAAGVAAMFNQRPELRQARLAAPATRISTPEGPTEAFSVSYGARK